MMEEFNITAVALTISIIIALYLYSSRSSASTTRQNKQREPPVVRSMIPYVGHLIGFLWYGQKYIERLSAKNRLPIFTLHILKIKIYVISAPELIAATDRAAKAFTFHPFVSMISTRLFDVGERAMAMINDNIDRADGQWGLTPETTQGMHSVLSPGPELDRMIEAMLTQFLPEANHVADSTVDLFAWVRESFAVASTYAIYGPGNPFAKHRDLEGAFWAFDEGLAPVLCGIPSPAARRAKKGRARLVEAMNEYFEKGEQENASALLQLRYRVARKYGATLDDISRFEVGDLIGILVNATPTLFWSILHVYSDPSLLQSLRDEVEAHMTTEDTNGQKTHKIDITTLQDTCPLLVATYRELLRYRTHFSAARWVEEDTVLAGQYLLTKGNVIQMPGGVAHANTAAWGPDADQFRPSRFLDKPRLVPGSYRAWGGGHTMCPGRFFATLEITSALALFVARFDVEPADGGAWVLPKEDSSRLVSSVSPPKRDVKVNIKTRAGMDGHRWSYAFRDGSKVR